MPTLKEAIEKRAVETQYRRTATEFRNRERWAQRTPVLSLTVAAGTTTGQSYYTHVKPEVDRLFTEYLESNDLRTFEAVSGLEPDDSQFEQFFSADRKRWVLVRGAEAFDRLTGTTDLERLVQWAEDADPFQYEEDPFGAIDGVGVRTFQFLRMLAGVDTVKPDIQVRRFLEELDREVETFAFEDGSDAEVIRQCELIADQTGYDLLELDQIAWWSQADTGDRTH